MSDAALPAGLPLRRLGAPLGIAATLASWELGARALEGTFLLAGPLSVAGYIAGNAGLLSRALAATLESAAQGFLLGNLAAVALAAIAVLVPRLGGAIAALALAVFCLPLVAVGPILRVLHGPGTGPQATLAALAVYYTTFVPLVVGLRAAPSGWFDLVDTYGRGRWAKLFHVRVFAAVPYLIAGLQIAAPAAILGAMIGEFTGAERGLGVLAIRAMRSLDAEATWALASIASAAAIALYALIGAAGRRLWPDRPALILAPPAGPARPVAERVLMALLAAMLILALWQVALDGFGLSRFFAKRPGDVWRFLVAVPEAAQNRATLLAALGQTFGYAVPGYLAGLALGALLACLFTLAPALASAALPVAIALRSIPILTTAPIIVLALGRGPAGTIAIVAVMSFFPTVVASLHGLRQAPGQVLDVFESYGAGRWRHLVLAQVPAALPAFFAAARMSVPAAILAVTVAEWLATGSGIGNLMSLTHSTSNYNMLWSAVAALTLVTFALYAAVSGAERAVLRTYAPEQTSA